MSLRLFLVDKKNERKDEICSGKNSSHRNQYLWNFHWISLSFLNYPLSINSNINCAQYDWLEYDTTTLHEVFSITNRSCKAGYYSRVGNSDFSDFWHPNFRLLHIIVGFLPKLKEGKIRDDSLMKRRRSFWATKGLMIILCRQQRNYCVSKEVYFWAESPQQEKSLKFEKAIVTR